MVGSGDGGAADDFLAEIADDGEGVPEKAAPRGEVTVADGDFFAVVAPVAGVAEAGDTAGGEAERERRKAHSCAVEAEVELIVGLKGVGRIEGAVRGEESAAIKGRLVVDEVAGAGIGSGIESVNATVGVGGFSGGDIGGGAGEQDGGEGEDVGVGEVVVGAKEEQPFATGGGDGAVHGVVNAGVGGAGNVGELRAMALKPSNGAIGGSAVDDDDLGGEIALVPDTGEGGGEAGAGVFADNEDADERRWGGHCVGDELQVGVGCVHVGFNTSAAALGHHRCV